MKKMNLNLLLASSFLFISTSANAWPDRENTYELLAKLKKVKCSLTISYVVQTKEGYSTPDEDNDEYNEVVLIDNAPVEASSPSKFASYSLSWENNDYKFYFFQNSQTGAIRLYDKSRSIEVESSLDIYDLDKEWPYLGSTQITRREDIMVTSPINDSEKIPGEKITYLKGTCHRLSNYLP